MNELTEMLDDLNEGFTQFKKRYNQRLDDLEAEIMRPRLGGTEVVNDLGTPELNAALRTFLVSGSDEQIKALSVGNDPSGGYAVLPHFSTAITRRLFETSPIRDLARVVDITTDAFEEIVDNDEFDAAWVSETAARPETDAADIAKLRIPVHEMYAMPSVTQKLLDDSVIDIAAWIIEKVGDKLRRKENAAFVNGDGVGKPRGFLTRDTAADADDARAWGTLQYLPTGASGAFASSDPGDVLISTIYAMKSEHRAGAWWLMNSATAGVVRKFKDADGRYLWADSLQAAEPPLLAGHPVRLLEDMPDISPGSFSVAFANLMDAYTIVDREGVRLLQDPYTNKPNVNFYTYRRVGGDVVNSEAIKLVKFAAS